MVTGTGVASLRPPFLERADTSGSGVSNARSMAQLASASAAIATTPVTMAGSRRPPPSSAMRPVHSDRWSTAHFSDSCATATSWVSTRARSPSSPRFVEQRLCPFKQRLRRSIPADHRPIGSRNCRNPGGTAGVFPHGWEDFPGCWRSRVGADPAPFKSRHKNAPHTVLGNVPQQPAVGIAFAPPVCESRRGLGRSIGTHRHTHRFRKDCAYAGDHSEECSRSP
jgi:hypothetical protein